MPAFEKGDSSPAELELGRQRALDHLITVVWIINDLIAAARFADRQKYTEIVGELSTIIRKFTEIGTKP
jgi:hypothetical protein